MRGDEVAAETGLKLLVIAVVQLVGAGKELRGIIIAQIEPNVVRLGQAKAPHRLPQRAATLLQRLAGRVHHVQIFQNRLHEAQVSAAERGLKQRVLAAEIPVDIDLIARNLRRDQLGRGTVKPLARSNADDRVDQQFPVILFECHSRTS